jgi:hypothetical protein
MTELPVVTNLRPAMNAFVDSLRDPLLRQSAPQMIRARSGSIKKARHTLHA